MSDDLGKAFAMSATGQDFKKILTTTPVGMPGKLAAIVQEVLAGRQLCDMTPDERDDTLTQATTIFKTRHGR